MRRSRAAVVGFVSKARDGVREDKRKGRAGRPLLECVEPCPEGARACAPSPYDMVMVFTTLAESAIQDCEPSSSEAAICMVRVRGVSVVSGS